MFNLKKMRNNLKKLGKIELILGILNKNSVNSITIKFQTRAMRKGDEEQRKKRNERTC